MDNKLFKVCLLACLAAGASACDEGKFNDLNCDASSYKAECLGVGGYMSCVDGKLTVTKCDDATEYCRATENGAECKAYVEQSEPAAACGNGSIDDGEECDGTLLADGKTFECPDGLEGAATCNTTTCKIDTTTCTTPVKPVPATCGDENYTVDEGEECDFDADGNPIFGDKTCATELDDAGATGELTCNSCKISTDSCTPSTPAPKLICESDSDCDNAECIRGICVTEEMKAIQAGDECDPDTFVPFTIDESIVECVEDAELQAPGDGEDAEDTDNAEAGEDTEDTDNTEAGEDAENTDNTEAGEDTEDTDNTEVGEDTENTDNTETGEDTETGDGDNTDVEPVATAKGHVVITFCKAESEIETDVQECAELDEDGETCKTLATKEIVKIGEDGQPVQACELDEDGETCKTDADGNVLYLYTVEDKLDADGNKIQACAELDEDGETCKTPAVAVENKLDADGNPIQACEELGEDGETCKTLAFEKDENGEYVLDEDGNQIPVYETVETPIYETVETPVYETETVPVYKTEKFEIDLGGAGVIEIDGELIPICNNAGGLDLTACADELDEVSYCDTDADDKAYESYGLCLRNTEGEFAIIDAYSAGRGYYCEADGDIEAACGTDGHCLNAQVIDCAQASYCDENGNAVTCTEADGFGAATIETTECTSDDDNAAIACAIVDGVAGCYESCDDDAEVAVCEDGVLTISTCADGVKTVETVECGHGCAPLADDAEEGAVSDSCLYLVEGEGKACPDDMAAPIIDADTGDITYNKSCVAAADGEASTVLAYCDEEGILRAEACDADYICATSSILGDTCGLVGGCDEADIPVVDAEGNELDLKIAQYASCSEDGTSIVDYVCELQNDQYILFLSDTVLCEEGACVETADGYECQEVPEGLAEGEVCQPLVGGSQCADGLACIESEAAVEAKEAVECVAEGEEGYDETCVASDAVEGKDAVYTCQVVETEPEGLAEGEVCQPLLGGSQCAEGLACIESEAAVEAKDAVECVAEGEEGYDETCVASDAVEGKDAVYTCQVSENTGDDNGENNGDDNGENNGENNGDDNGENNGDDNGENTGNDESLEG